MAKTINHNAFVNLFNKNPKVFELVFKDTNTLTKLTNKIIKVSKDYESYGYRDYYKDGKLIPGSFKLKGDIFEIFAECFFKILSADNRIGIYNYQPAPPIDDYGVDGTGIGMDTKPATIQVKFRSDATTELTQDDLNQFAFQSVRKYRVDIDTKTNLILFTNARGLHWVTEKNVFLDSIKPIGYSQISKLIDKNSVFWNETIDMVKNTIVVKYS